MAALFKNFFLILVFFVSFSDKAFADGAFYVELPDAAAVGKGSAFVGEANNPSAVYYNPAGISQIKQPEVSLGFATLAPAVAYKPTSGNEVEMRQNKFLIPHIYAVAPLNERFHVGLGATSFFGLGTEWADDSSLKYIATKSDIENKDYMLTASYKITETWSFAVSADNDDSKVNQQKKLFQGASDGDFQLKAKDNAWGYRLATMLKLSEQHQLGLMYKSRISHRYDGKVYLNNLNNTATVDVTNDGVPDIGYQTVFGGSSYETRANEKFTLPQSVVIGYSFKPTTKWTFNVDVEWMDWSSVKNEIVNFPDAGTLANAVLTSANPINHDWKSVWSQNVGVEYSVLENLRLRGGYYHHGTPIPQGTWNPNLPDSNSHGVTTGIGYDLTKNLTFDIAYSALFYEPRKIDNTLGNASSASVDGRYKQVLNMGVITLTYKF